MQPASPQREDFSRDGPIERQLRELRILHALADRINRSVSLDELYPETLAALRRAVQADRAAVLLLDAAGSMRFVASDGLSEAYRRAVEGHSPWAANETQARPVLVPDPAREPSLAKLLPLLCAEGIASLAFVPIAHQDRLLGKFMLYFDAPHEMQPEEVRLVLTIAEYLALAISRQAAVEEIRRLNADLEEQVRSRTRQLEEANREMEAFCHLVSHVLRTPLRALDGFSRVLLEDAGALLGEQDKAHLQRIIAASGRMGQMMDDLLRFIRIGRVRMRLAEVDLGALAAEILAGLRRQAPQRPAQVRITPGLAVRADPGLMRIALEHLLGNAWKYTQERDPAQIEFGVREEDGKAVYFIRDNGAGFDMRYAARLFSPFQRLHPPAAFEGNGIGLAIVQRIVGRHGGRIRAESEPGRGSTFCFTLWQDGIPPEPAAPVSPPSPSA